MLSNTTPQAFAIRLIVLDRGGIGPTVHVDHEANSATFVVSRGDPIDFIRMGIAAGQLLHDRRIDGIKN